MLIDIGGGSTELSVCHNNSILSPVSIPLGTVRAHATLLSEIPATPEQIEAFRHTIQVTLRGLPSIFSEVELSRAIGSSGTIRTLCAIQSIHRSQLTDIPTNNIINFVNSLCSMNLDQINAVEGMDEKRADIILGGAIILAAMIDFFSIKYLRPSPYSLRHGLLSNIIEEFGEE